MSHPRNITSQAELQDQAQYAVAYQAPGLNGYHHGVPWTDGVCAPVSGYQVRAILGSFPCQVWEYHSAAQVRWTPRGPVYELQAQAAAPAAKPSPKTSSKRRAAPKK